jgi:ATP phosphoribosyltransferase regulatory subunit HisZ
MPIDHRKVEEIRRQITDLEKRWPAHSTPPALMQQLDELEAELEKALSRNEGVGKNHSGSEAHT